MPVDAIRRWVGLGRPARSWCVVRPDRGDWLEQHGLVTAGDFLALPGVVVSGHIGRNVSRVEVGSATGYLKREHRVRVRDRFRSWRDGFGWASVSAREVAVLRRLDEHGVPGPTWLAVGEAGGEAFVLLEAVSEAVELRALHSGGMTFGPAVGLDLPERLGRIVAGLHAAGIDQPDLFAKHVLVRPGTGELTILDWQRATLRPAVPGANRIRGLAALAATTPEGVFSPAAWDRLLAAYHSASPAAGRGPTLEGVRRAVARCADRLRRRSAIRSQLVPAAAQQLVRIGGETVCAIPAAAAELDDPAAIAALYAPANDGWPVCFANGMLGVLRVRRYPLPVGRWWAAVRARAWRSPELRAARLLFHLERHGIPAPKLLAYGQKGAGSFVLSEPLSARPPRTHDRDLVRDLLVRLHSVGCRLRGLGPAGEPFGVRDGAAVVTDVRCLRLDRRLSSRHARRDLARLDATFRGM